METRKMSNKSSGGDGKEFSVKEGKFAKNSLAIERKDIGTDVEKQKQCNLAQKRKTENPKRGRKRVADSENASSKAPLKHRRSATNLPKTSEQNEDFPCKTTLTAPLSTGAKVSKVGALQRLGEDIKRGLFEKTSVDKVTCKLKKPRVRRKNKHTSPEVEKCKDVAKKSWQDIPLQSESLLLLTPDPVSIERRISPKTQDPSPYSQRLSFDGNLSKDTCDSSDSENELPECLTPAKRDGQFSRGDLVWAQIRGWPFWPGVVTGVYRKKKKVSVRFINDVSSPKKKIKTYPMRLRNSSKTLYQFTDRKRNQFEDEGYKTVDKPLIEDAVKKVEDYLNKLGLGLVKTNALNYFYPNSEADGAKDIEPDFNGIRRLDSISSMESEEIIVESPEKDIPESETIRARNERRRNRCENLVEFIKSQKMKDYLLQVYYGKKDSFLHKSYYGSVSEKNKIRNPGFGPINDDDQRTEVLDNLVSWAMEIKGFKAAYMDYVMDVWLPEAIVFALIQVKGYGRSRAWKLFQKGIRFTKEELAASHKALLEAAERISPQDKIMYREKLQDRMRRFLADPDLKHT